MIKRSWNVGTWRDTVKIDNTKCYTQNFNPGLTLIGPSGTGAGSGGYIICSFRWMSLDSALLIMWIFQGFPNYSLPSLLGKITIIYHKVHSYQS